VKSPAGDGGADIAEVERVKRRSRGICRGRAALPSTSVLPERVEGLAVSERQRVERSERRQSKRNQSGDPGECDENSETEDAMHYEPPFLTTPRLAMVSPFSSDGTARMTRTIMRRM
jgi:hypothetical protein